MKPDEIKFNVLDPLIQSLKFFMEKEERIRHSNESNLTSLRSCVEVKRYPELSILSFEFYIFNGLLYKSIIINNGNIEWKAPTIDERKDIINRFIQQKMAYIEGLGLGFEDLIDHSIDPNIDQETDITVKLNYHAPEEKIDLIRVLLKMQGYPVNVVITDTSDMFKNCASLTSIDLSALTSIPKSKLKF